MIRRAHGKFPPPGTERRRTGASRADGGGVRPPLDEIVHPDLIPAPDLSRVGDPSLSRPDRGETVEAVLRRWGGAPLPGWRRRCPGGIRDVLDSFSRLARLLGELSGAGLSIPRLHPRALRLGLDGRIRLDAMELERELDRELDRPTDGGAPPPDGRTRGAREGLEPTSDEWAPYLAPERLLATEDDAHRSGDEAGVYSLASILHHCLSGSPPWSGRSPAEVADRILAGAPPTPIPADPDIPRGIAPLLVDALALDPRQRPARFRGFAAALESAARGGRPRSGSAHRNAAPSRVGPWMRIGVLLVLVVASVVIARRGADERERRSVLRQLDSALAARPFPLHGEDPPRHPVGHQVLREAGDSARRWDRDPEMLVALGWASLRAGDPRRASECFSRARQWDPDSGAPFISLGIARLERGDPAGRLELSRGLSLAPRTPRERLLRAIGELYLHRFERAVAAFRLCLEIDGPSHRLWFHLALAAHHAGSEDEAERALDRAAALQPHDVWIQWLGAEILALRGDAAEVLRRMETYKSEWVESPALLRRGAVLLLRLGYAERAQEWWDRAQPDRSAPLAGHEVRWTDHGLLRFPSRVVLELPPLSPPPESP